MPTNSQAHLPPDGAFCFAQLSICCVLCRVLYSFYILRMTFEL